MAITPFKVIQGHYFGTNRRPVCDFLVMNNINLRPISRIVFKLLRIIIWAMH